VKFAHVVSAFVLVVASVFAVSCDSGDDDGDNGPCGYSLVECDPAPGTNYPAAPTCVDGNWVCDTYDAGADSGIADASSRPDASDAGEEADAPDDADAVSDALTDAPADGDAAGD
jgi:hypothetical protein